MLFGVSGLLLLLLLLLHTLHTHDYDYTMMTMMIERSGIIPKLPTVKEKMINDSSTGIKYYLLPYYIKLFI